MRDGMMPIGFEVEQVALIAQDLPVVLARRLSAQNFTIVESSTLGGCCVWRFLEIPRSVRADGSPRVDLFAFALCSADDMERFTPGQRVLLEDNTTA